MQSIIFKPLSYLPLRILHCLGAALGGLLFYCMPQAKQRAIANITQSQLAKNSVDAKSIAHKSFAELGKTIFETPMIWQKNEVQLLTTVQKIHGWEIVKNALQTGKGIIFLTPHLGCFEITSIYYGNQHPITVLYRPPKLTWLTSLILKGRARTGVSLATADASGVRKLFKALKRGEAIGILPDQIPAAGEGEWTDFFGKPAYTMSLASKLAEKTGATVIMGYGERLKNGVGFDIHLTKIDSIATTTLLNAAIEQQITQNPSQYLWSYNRYKVRNHALKKQAQQTNE